MQRKKPTKKDRFPSIDRELLKEFLSFLVRVIGMKVEDKLIKALLIGGIAAAGNFYDVDEDVMLNREPPAAKIQIEKAQ